VLKISRLQIAAYVSVRFSGGSSNIKETVSPILSGLFIFTLTLIALSLNPLALLRRIPAKLFWTSAFTIVFVIALSFAAASVGKKVARNNVRVLDQTTVIKLNDDNTFRKNGEIYGKNALLDFRRDLYLFSNNSTTFVLRPTKIESKFYVIRLKSDGSIATVVLRDIK